MITPDTKDWTWVLRRPCADCGLDVPQLRCADVAARLRDNASAWRAVLSEVDDVRRRPSPQVWSVLEYACHVRDVCRLYDQRLQLMLTEHDPQFANWDQDETAVSDGYAEQDPVVVAAELDRAAATLADRFDGVSGAEWERTGNRTDGAHFTVDSFSRYFLHDVVHHLYDVRP